MQRVYERLKTQEPFTMLRFNGSGKLCCVNDKGAYYDKLGRVIQTGLQRTPTGNKLYILFVTRSRLMRPSGYDYTNQSATWTYSVGDYKVFNQWVRDAFGARADNVRFVILCPLSPANERYFESWLGKFYQKCLKNIGKRLSRKMSQMFRSIVIGLRKRQGLSTSEIVRHLEDVYEQAPKERTIRDWLQRAGLAEKRGRRWKNTNRH